jgi:PII-like signaling protein
VIEIVDTREKLEAFLDLIEREIQAGWVTLEEIRIRFYRRGDT